MSHSVVRTRNGGAEVVALLNLDQPLVRYRVHGQRRTGTSTLMR